MRGSSSAKSRAPGFCCTQHWHFKSWHRPNLPARLRKAPKYQKPKPCRLQALGQTHLEEQGASPRVETSTGGAQPAAAASPWKKPAHVLRHPDSYRLPRVTHHLLGDASKHGATAFVPKPLSLPTLPSLGDPLLPPSSLLYTKALLTAACTFYRNMIKMQEATSPFYFSSSRKPNQACICISCRFSFLCLISHFTF